MPPPSPLTNGYLNVGDGHQIYFETAGNCQGIPVLALHGGPGSGTGPRLRELYDGKRFHTTFFDQRGAGRSLPAGELRANTLAYLLADIEALRQRLNIERWLVTGGSWGAALALAYASSAPDAVSGVLVRSIFLTGESDLAWFFHGARSIYPKAWSDLAAQLPAADRHQILVGLHRQLTGHDASLAQNAAIAWHRYEQTLASGADAFPVMPGTRNQPAVSELVAKYRIQAHYLINHCFLGEEQLLSISKNLSNVPVAIIHGTLDPICRPENAKRLRNTIPESSLCWAEGAGHNPFHPAMALNWRRQMAHFAKHHCFGHINPRIP